MKVQVHARIDEIPREAWNDLEGAADAPFVSWDWLRALEASGSVGAAAGWRPLHVAAWRGRTLVGACPTYVKLDSWGEFVYDFALARFAERAGRAWYPKLVVASPFTPATGRRLLLAPGEPGEPVVDALVGGLQGAAERVGAAGVHVLFCRDDEVPPLVERGGLHRTQVQFHWEDAGYGDFEGWLAALRSRRRKGIRRELRRVEEAGVIVRPLVGREAAAVLPAMEAFYRRNTRLHGGRAYLRPGFWRWLAGEGVRDVVMFGAWRGEELVGGALCLRGRDTLYGRYWGAAEDLPDLHFACTLHEPIRWCLARGVRRFEAGQGGIHKLLRGLAPRTCHSVHFLRDPDLARVVGRFFAEEREEVARRSEELAQHGPYRKG